ncbi:MAG TPA: A/G-specific adenine glycosylase [Bryobacteraceae bacterium]
MKRRVSSLLARWYAQGHRDLPWRRTADPYRIWVSEIMLQQTRAAAVVPYYRRFLERFPTVEALASASEPEVLALWSGLGYYSRARNLLRAAREIAARGAFPRQYDELRQLAGVGDYTAAAVASIAFGSPRAVLDGNVLRVVARMENDAGDIRSSKTRERFREVAESWLDPKQPGAFNQALMELGATVCLPRRPLCIECPLRGRCQALQQGTVDQLPVKLGAVRPERIDAVLLLVRRGRRILLRQRPATERRMPGFWDLPAPEHLPGAGVGAAIGIFRHTITHHHYTFTVKTARAPKRLPAGSLFRWLEPREAAGIPLSTTAGIPLSTTAKKALRLAGWL